MSGRDDEHAGYSGGNPFRRHEDADESPGAGNESPVDLTAVQADDALLDMLGGNEAGRSTADAELARVLVAWRRDVDAEPIGELVDTDTAVAAISAARKPAARKHPVLGPVAAAAAVLVIAFSGVGLVAKSAQPDDQLWSLTKVLYADYARSVETAQKVRYELDQIDKALEEGKTTPAQARQSLEQVQKELAVVDEEQGKTELATESKKLEQKLATMPPVPGETDSPPPEPAAPPPPPQDAPVAPVPSEPAPSTPPEPTVLNEPTTVPSTPPPTPSVPPGEPTPGTSAPTPRASPPADTTGATPPVTSPSG